MLLIICLCLNLLTLDGVDPISGGAKLLLFFDICKYLRQKICTSQYFCVSLQQNLKINVIQ